MKAQICSINREDVDYFIKQAHKQGYKVYIDDTKQYCVDVLTDSKVCGNLDNYMGLNRIITFDNINGELVCTNILQ